MNITTSAQSRLGEHGPLTSPGEPIEECVYTKATEGFNVFNFYGVAMMLVIYQNVAVFVTRVIFK